MRNLKFTAILLPVLCAGMVSYGKSVDETNAKKTGSNFLISEKVKGVNSSADLSTAYVATAKVAGKTIIDYYVFNINGSNGFVMVAGDDKIIPILAYSNTSAFDINSISPSTKAWIEGYQNQITYTISQDLPADNGTPEKWAALSTAVSASTERTTSGSGAYLLTTQWDQYPYYNQLCPTDGSAGAYGGRDVTGCVATAMSQIMKFWNWPTVGCGYHSYVCASHGTQAANFGITDYQWSSMPNSLTASGVSATQKNAVATLMYHAGVSVDMQYTAAESGAYTISLESPVLNCAEYALKNYFHFKPTLKGIPRFGDYYGGSTGYPDSMTTSAWITMLVSELTAGRPMLYSGNGTVGGHAWVCDGWETTSSMFHFNWGWSGQSDGWYTVNNLAPPALGVGAGSGNFNFDQCVIMGIQPDSFPSTPGNIKLLANLNCTTPNAMGYASPISVTTKILNSNTTTFSGDLCAQVFDTSNHLVGTIQTMLSQTITAGDSTASLTFSNPAIYAMLPEIYYHIQIMYRTSSSSPWTPVANNGTFYNYSAVAVANDTDVLVYNPITTSPALPIRQGRAFYVACDLFENSSTTSFSGSVEAVLINISTGTIYPIQVLTSQNIGAATSNHFNFSISSVTAPIGSYVLEILHQYGGTGSFYTSGNLYNPNPILTQVISAVDVPNVSAQDDIVIYPNPANDIINIAYGTIGVTEIRISDLQGREIEKITPDATQTLSSISVSNYAAGVYFVQLKTASEVITKNIVVAK